MQAHEVKEGMRVVWSYGKLTDRGTVILHDGELVVDRLCEQSVYVVWDSDGEVQFASLNNLEAIEPHVSKQEITEQQQAVELLLNLSYTLTKQNREQ